MTAHFKLGLFAVAGVVGVTATAVGLGVHATRVPTTTYHTYFDESVQGLELGAPVKYRGVHVGSVAHVDIAPDGRHVDVALAIAAREARGLPLEAPDLRAQLGNQGITGVKFVDLDFADPAEGPPAALAFAVSDHTILSRPSLFQHLEDEASRLAHDVPALVGDARTTLHRVDAMLDDVTREGIPARVGTALDELHALERAATGEVADLRRLTGRAGELVDAGARAVDRVGDGADKTTTAVTDLARRGADTTGELDRTLRELAETSRTVRDFIDALDRDPDMLVKGRAPARKR